MNTNNTIYKRNQAGEIATLLTVFGLVVMALGTIAGTAVIKNPNIQRFFTQAGPQPVAVESTSQEGSLYYNDPQFGFNVESSNGVVRINGSLCVVKEDFQSADSWKIWASSSNDGSGVVSDTGSGVFNIQDMPRCGEDGVVVNPNASANRKFFLTLTQPATDLTAENCPTVYLNYEGAMGTVNNILTVNLADYGVCTAAVGGTQPTFAAPKTESIDCSAVSNKTARTVCTAEDAMKVYLADKSIQSAVAAAGIKGSLQEVYFIQDKQPDSIAGKVTDENDPMGVMVFDDGQQLGFDPATFATESEPNYLILWNGTSAGLHGIPFGQYDCSVGATNYVDPNILSVTLQSGFNSLVFDKRTDGTPLAHLVTNHRSLQVRWYPGETGDQIQLWVTNPGQGQAIGMVASLPRPAWLNGQSPVNVTFRYNQVQGVNDLREFEQSIQAPACVTPFTPTVTPVLTTVPSTTPTSTPVPTTTSTPVPTSTSTPTPSMTSTPTPSSTSTPTPSPTNVPPTATPTSAPVACEYDSTISIKDASGRTLALTDETHMATTKWGHFYNDGTQMKKPGTNDVLGDDDVPFENIQFGRPFPGELIGLPSQSTLRVRTEKGQYSINEATNLANYGGQDYTNSYAQMHFWSGDDDEEYVANQTKYYSPTGWKCEDKNPNNTVKPCWDPRNGGSWQDSVVINSIANPSDAQYVYDIKIAFACNADVHYEFTVAQACAYDSLVSVEDTEGNTLQYSDMNKQATTKWGHYDANNQLIVRRNNTDTNGTPMTSETVPWNNVKFGQPEPGEKIGFLPFPGQTDTRSRTGLGQYSIPETNNLRYYLDNIDYRGGHAKVNFWSGDENDSYLPRLSKHYRPVKWTCTDANGQATCWNPFAGANGEYQSSVTIDATDAVTDTTLRSRNAQAIYDDVKIGFVCGGLPQYTYTVEPSTPQACAYDSLITLKDRSGNVIPLTGADKKAITKWSHTDSGGNQIVLPGNRVMKGDVVPWGNIQDGAEQAGSMIVRPGQAPVKVTAGQYSIPETNDLSNYGGVNYIDAKAEINFWSGDAADGYVNRLAKHYRPVGWHCKDAGKKDGQAGQPTCFDPRTNLYSDEVTIDENVPGDEAYVYNIQLGFVCGGMPEYEYFVEPIVANSQACQYDSLVTVKDQAGNVLALSDYDKKATTKWSHYAPDGTALLDKNGQRLGTQMVGWENKQNGRPVAGELIGFPGAVGRERTTVGQYSIIETGDLSRYYQDINYRNVFAKMNFWSGAPSDGYQARLARYYKPVSWTCNDTGLKNSCWNPVSGTYTNRVTVSSINSNPQNEPNFIFDAQRVHVNDVQVGFMCGGNVEYTYTVAPVTQTVSTAPADAVRGQSSDWDGDGRITCVGDTSKPAGQTDMELCGANYGSTDAANQFPVPHGETCNLFQLTYIGAHCGQTVSGGAAPSPTTPAGLRNIRNLNR